MKCCTLAKSLNPWCIGISPNLFYSIQPLFLRLLHRTTIFLEDILQLFIKLLSGENLEFEDVAVLTGIMGMIRLQEEITIAMIQLQFGSRDVIIVEVQVCHKETLQVSLRFYSVTHRRNLSVGISHETQSFLPYTIISHIVIVIRQSVSIHIRLCLILFFQISIILLANIIIRNAQNQLRATCTLDGLHAIIKQQTWEDFSLRYLIGRELFLQLGNNLSLFRYLADDTLALAIQLIELQELLHLAIISLGIRVYHLPRRASVIHIIAKIVKHHIAIKHSDTLIQCFFCKAIVVVPRFISLTMASTSLSAGMLPISL